MPRNAVTKHILTIYIYIHACLVSSITRFRRQSVTWTWYKLLRVKVQKVHFSWTKLGFADPYLRNLNFVCCCGMHIETLPFPKTDFHLPAEVAVTWQKRPPNLIWQYRRSRLVSLGDVRAQGRVQEWPSRKRLGTMLQPTNKSVDFLCCALREFCSSSQLKLSCQPFFSDSI